ncbi:hypothetical protein BC830DRAFT_1090798 [Chytriomyces sp. MP71]|nr:hypothetical protein BC830DRAFT_1090798 [Chytriomyces sp. MP71]
MSPALSVQIFPLQICQFGLAFMMNRLVLDQEVKITMWDWMGCKAGPRWLLLHGNNSIEERVWGILWEVKIRMKSITLHFLDVGSAAHHS